MKNSIHNVLGYFLKTRRTWWFTAIAKTKARYARTVLGSFWLGISTLMTVLCLGFVYGKVFNVPNFLEYFIYLGFGLVIWTPICEAINQAPLIFSTNSNSLKNSTIKPIFFVCQEWAFLVQSFFQAFIMVFIVFLIKDSLSKLEATLITATTNKVKPNKEIISIATASIKKEGFIPLC